MAKVDIEQVSKVYAGGVRAVDRIDLHIKDQEFVVLVGPSGCGKSTTLRMVAGLEEISEGVVRIGERIVNNVAPKDRDIAMVFQNYALYPHMSVYKNMAFGLKLRGMPKAEIHTRVMDAAKILEIEHLLERKPKALSGGQRQRVAVGRAIVREPAAFLFDEPLSNLDAKLRVTTRAQIKSLHQRLKTTTIYVTHDQEEAMTLGDRIVVMKEGVIMQEDTPLVTYRRPKNRFIAGFIGMPPMNFFDGALKMDSGTGDLVFEEGKLQNARVAGTKAEKAKAKGQESDEPVVLVGELTLPGNGFRLVVPKRLRSLLAGKVGAHVVLGIRPEHFHVQPMDASIEQAKLDLKVNVVEPLGNDMDVYMNSALHPHVVGRIEAQGGLQMGSQMTVNVDLRNIHFFEPGETGANLCLGADEVTSSARESVLAMA